EREESRLGYQTDYRSSFYEKDLKESRIKGSETTRNRYLSEHLEGYKIYHFHDTSVSSPMRTEANVNDNRRLKEDGSNLPAYLYFLKKKYPKNYKRIERTIQGIIPFFERFDLQPTSLEEDNILLEWNEIGHPDTYFNAKHL